MGILFGPYALLTAQGCYEIPNKVYNFHFRTHTFYIYVTHFDSIAHLLIQSNSRRKSLTSFLHFLADQYHMRPLLKGRRQRERYQSYTKWTKLGLFTWRLDWTDSITRAWWATADTSWNWSTPTQSTKPKQKGLSNIIHFSWRILPPLLAVPGF